MWNEPTEQELSLLPGLYETEDIPMLEKIIHMHLFCGNADWYIAEYDKENNLFFGFANLGDIEMAEWGYISLDELKEIKVKIPVTLQNAGITGHGTVEVDRDLHWKPKKFKEIEEVQGWID